MDLRNGPIQKEPEKKRHTIRNLSIIFAGMLLTTFVVQATDTIRNTQEALVSNAVTGIILETNDGCPNDMVFVSSTRGGFCIDKFEVSAGETCPYDTPLSINETHANLNTPGCVPVSKKGKTAWTNVSQTQAIEICSKVGKHLPSNEEWFLGSLGTPDIAGDWKKRDCNVAQNWNGMEVGKTGTGDACESTAGAYDMIGNVWEWTNETVTMGVYKNIPLPKNGYVQGVMTEGLPLETGNEASPLFYGDRFWVDDTKVTGIFRGGYFGSGSDAGRFAVHAETAPTFAAKAVGFRCAK